MGILNAWERWKYGERLEFHDFERFLAERGLSLDEIDLPDLLNKPKINDDNPYRSPEMHSKIPHSEIYEYFRVGKGDKIEYFEQHIADRKKDGLWIPGAVVHAPIKLPVKKKVK